MFVDQADKLRNMVNSQNNNIRIANNSKVIAITSGKGGSGKSNFVANVAIELVRNKKRVLIIDADLGLSNIEILYGIMPKRNLAHLINGKNTIKEIISEGPLGIKLISGGRGLKELNDIDARTQKKMLKEFAYLDDYFDYILIDTGAGITNIILNFVFASDKVIIVTNPEPTAITDSYAMIKLLKEGKEDIDVNIVVNKVEDIEEGKNAFKKVHMVCKKFLNLEVKGLGIILYDEKLNRAIKKQVPMAIEYPKSDYSRNIKLITDKIINEKYSVDIDENKKGARGFLKKILGM